MDEQNEKHSNLDEKLKEKDDNNLVVDENKQIIDIYDIIEQNKGNGESTVDKINMLLDYGAGVTIEQIVEKYNEISGGGVLNEKIALENLEKAYRAIAEIVSKTPNGIIIDPNTGKKDEVKSRQQAAKYGIDGAENYSKKISKVDKFFEKELKKSEEITGVVKDSAIVVNDWLNTKKENSFIDNIISDLGKDVDNSNFSKSLKNEIKNTKNEILSKNAIIMKFSILFSESQEFPDRSKKELNDFMEEFPEYNDDFLQVLKNGVDKNEIELYQNASIKNSFSSIMADINSKSKTELMSIDEETKKLILIRALATVNTATSNEYLEEVEKSIKTIFPDIKSIIDFDTMGKILGVPPDKVIETALEAAAVLAKEDINVLIKWQKENKSFDPIKNKEMGNYFIENGKTVNVDEVTKSPHEIYFKDSKIEFDKSNLSAFRVANAICRTSSWIESKDNLIEYEYFSLLNRREVLNDSRATKINIKAREELKSIEESIKKFEEKHTDFNKEKYLKDGRLKSEYKSKIRVFEKAKTRGDILSNYIEDEEKVKSPEDYLKLSVNEKAKFLRDTLYGIPDGPIMKRFAMRRLEIISSENKSFISFDENNNPHINEELLIQECMKFNVLTKENSDILKNPSTFATELSRYTIKKLESYEDLPDKYFVKLDDVSEGTKLQKLEAQVKQIEQIKLQNRLEYSRDTTNEPEKNSEETREIVQRSERVMTQNEIDKLIKKMQEQSKEESFKEKISNALLKNNKEFEEEMGDLIYDDPISAQECLKGIVESKDNQSISNFQNKIMFMQESIKQAAKEKLKEAFGKDNEQFKTDIKDLVKLNPGVAQEFLKDFLKNPENLKVRNCNEKVMTLQDTITEQINERGGDKSKTGEFLSPESIDISSLPRQVGTALFGDNQNNVKSEKDDDELCL